MTGSALTLVLGVACAALGGCAGAAPAPAIASPVPGAMDAAVRGTIEQWRQAYEVRSVEALSALYSREPDVVVAQQGGIARGWTAVEAALSERLGRATQVHVRLKDLAVSALGEYGAAAVANMTREVSDGVTTVTEEGILTLALRRSSSSWSIVSEHYSYAVR